MKKIKYQGAATKLIGEKLAAINRRLFLKNIERILCRLTQNKKTGFDIISYSGAASFEDQLLSIYSFVYYGGIPDSWIIYSDKSYTQDQKIFFRKHFPFVSVIDWDVFDYVKNNSSLNGYLEVCHLAKKINIILGHSYSKQTIYVDSDVIFYTHISHYLYSNIINDGLWYISDTLGDMEKYFAKKPGTIYPLNSGFLILNNNFKKEYVLNYFEDLNGNYHYFSEQSSLDFALRKQRATVLDPREFIVDTSDQFDFSPKYSPDSIALRHYVSPVRHKMWQKGWKWNFQ